jgi:S1-C subfamily serine protease
MNRRQFIMAGTAALAIMPRVGLAGPLNFLAEPAGLEHPAGAFHFPMPEGWQAQQFVDGWGYPFHFVGPVEAGKAEDTGSGLRVHAIPIVPGFRPTLESTAPFAVMVATAAKSWVAPKLQQIQNSKIGPSDGRTIPLFGKSSKEDWQGEVRFALEPGFLYVAHSVAPAADWKAVSAKCDAALAGFKIPRPYRFVRNRPEKAETLEDVAKRIRPSVPCIHTLFRSNPDKTDEMVHLSSGSGFIVTKDGYVITNRHVVERMEVTTNNQRHYRFAYDPVRLEWDRGTKLMREEADVIAISFNWDLALLKIRGNKQWTPVPFADPAKIEQGQKIIVAGWPDVGEGTPVFTTNEGILSAFHYLPGDKNDDIPRLYQHSARTNSGNSGGLLYSLSLGGAIGVHVQALVSKAKGFQDVVAHGAVPLSRVFAEFPQLIPGNPQGKLSQADRLTRAATFFHQRRDAAALTELSEAFRDQPQAGMPNAFKYQILTRQGEPDAVVQPSYAAAERDPESKELAFSCRGRGYLERAEWGKLNGLVVGELQRLTTKLPKIGDASTHSNRHAAEINLLNGYCLGTFGMLGASKAFLQGESAEIEVLLGVEKLRAWMLANKITALPAPVKLAEKLADEIRALLEKGLTRWPTFHEMALLYLAYLEAALGNRKQAEAFFSLADRSGRKDRFFLSNFLYYTLLTRQSPLDALVLALQAHTPVSPGTHFMYGWACIQLAEVYGKLDLKKNDEKEAAEEVLQALMQLKVLPPKTQIDEVAKRLSGKGTILRDEGLLYIHRGNYADYSDLREKREKVPAAMKNPDGWWGPFVYLHLNREWIRR